MTAHDDAYIGELLASHVPERGEIAPDWANVLRRADFREPWRLKLSRRSLAIAFAVILVAMIASALALSAENDWWFLGDGQPSPNGDVVVVARGTWDGRDWNLSAFRTDNLHRNREELCFALTPGELPNPRGPRFLGASETCGPIPGSPSARPDKITFGGFGGPEWVTNSDGTSFPRHIFGSVVGKATRVRIELISGETIETKTIPAPTQLGLSVRFFVTALPGSSDPLNTRSEDLARIVALDDGGNIVGKNTVLCSESNPSPLGCTLPPYVKR